MARPPRKAGWTRRDVFNWILNITMGVIAMIVAVPVVGAVLTPVFQKQKEQWVDLGLASGLQSSSVAAGSGGVGTVIHAPYTYNEIDHWATKPSSDYAYLRYVGGECPFFVLSPICTHLGCHVNWVPSANQFHCPCHGSVYTIDGTNVSGPAPRPLGYFQWKIMAGHLYIAKPSIPRYSEADRKPCGRVS